MSAPVRMERFPLAAEVLRDLELTGYKMQLCAALMGELSRMGQAFVAEARAIMEGTRDAR